jgi:hypothetical protein
MTTECRRFFCLPLFKNLLCFLPLTARLISLSFAENKRASLGDAVQSPQRRKSEQTGRLKKKQNIEEDLTTRQQFMFFKKGKLFLLKLQNQKYKKSEKIDKCSSFLFFCDPNRFSEFLIPTEPY